MGGVIGSGIFFKPLAIAQSVEGSTSVYLLWIGVGLVCLFGAFVPVSPSLMAGLASAAVAVFWAYEGWYQLPFNAAEMKQPQRDLPRALVFGTVLSLVIYVATNAVYLHVVPFEEMRRLTSDIDVPMLTIRRSFGAEAGGLFSYFLCLSVLGAANPCMLSSPRAMYAMSQDKLLPRWFMSMAKDARTTPLPLKRSYHCVFINTCGIQRA